LLINEDAFQEYVDVWFLNGESVAFSQDRILSAVVSENPKRIK
jgi:hypothetical protein